MGLLTGLSDRLKGKNRPQVEEGVVAALTETQILKALKQVQGDKNGKDVVSLGLIRGLRMTEAGEVSFELHVPDTEAPAARQLQKRCEQSVSSVPGAHSIRVDLKARPQQQKARSQTTGHALGRVKHIVAVASGKGGVGKSTTSLNLARALVAGGLKVGLLDADIYGPSLEVLSGVTRPDRMDGERVVPPVQNGIKMISVSMFSQAEKAQVLRGPMAANLVRQFLDQVSWGELDYLIIDYPPGTGDVQLTISQVISVTAAVVVTTPQEVALVDVRKAIHMFSSLKVPVLGVVENMSYFLCDGCDKKHYIFSEGGGRNLAKASGLPLLGEIPVAVSIREHSDNGEDFVSGREQASGPAEWYKILAGNVIRETELLKAASQTGLGEFSLTWRTTEQEGERL